jgi:hypothetical protein
MQGHWRVKLRAPHPTETNILKQMYGLCCAPQLRVAPLFRVPEAMPPFATTAHSTTSTFCVIQICPASQTWSLKFLTFALPVMMACTPKLEIASLQAALCGAPVMAASKQLAVLQACP